MKSILLLLVVTQAIAHVRPSASLDDQVEAVKALINRVLPSQTAELFNVELNQAEANTDYFKLTSTKLGAVQIVATSGVAAATGFHYYLKYVTKSHISWEASQLSLPDILPQVDVTIPLNDRFRYYQNVCTTSYSMVWWSWAQWERHIDWIALNGFNLVLAFNGQEAIWDRVYQRFNLTSNEISEHFSGPAFLSWLRMGNIRAWGGPLTSAWHQRSLDLQKKILSRMRSFGMIGVLPAFAGHLPRAFKRLYPDANMVQVGQWNDFEDAYCCPYFLDPTEDLFNQIGTAFLAEQIAEFGTDHVYNCDSFNENTPSTGDLTYLANVGKATYKAMTDVDSDAIWVMQGWPFVHDFLYWTRNRVNALLTSVPNGKMIVLDLQSEQFPQYERLEQYFGQPYIWCMLHNFGGTLGMFGSSNIVNQRPYLARQTNGSTMIGTGLTPEGINQNYVIYDLMVEHAWRTNSTNLVQWVQDYATRRYGVLNEDANQAWSILINTVYNYEGEIRMRGKYTINRSPTLKINPWTWYGENELLTAWTYLLKAAPKIGKNPGYYHDVVDVSRQVLQNFGDTYYLNLAKEYEKKDINAFLQYSATYLEIFVDLEELLASDEAFLLGRWLDDAKNAASSIEEEKQFVYNAKNQISLWGPNGEIMDYANKQWSGVVADLFAPRWQTFLIYLADVLTTNITFNNAYIKNKIFNEIEQPFTLLPKVYPTEPKGDSVEIASRIYKKWIQRRYQDRKLKTL